MFSSFQNYFSITFNKYSYLAEERVRGLLGKHCCETLFILLEQLPFRESLPGSLRLLPSCEAFPCTPSFILTALWRVVIPMQVRRGEQSSEWQEQIAGYEVELRLEPGSLTVQQASADFFCKGLDSKCFGFYRPYTQVCRCSIKAIDIMPAVSWIWPMGCSLPTPTLESYWILDV